MFGTNLCGESAIFLKEKNTFLEDLLCSKTYGLLSAPEPVPTIQELSWLSIYFTGFAKNSAFRDKAFGIGTALDPQEAKLKALSEGVERWVAFSPPPRSISRKMSLREMQACGDMYLAPENWHLHKNINPQTDILWYQSVEYKNSKVRTWHPYSFTKNENTEHFWERHSSGFSCHENLDRAILHSVQELIERDCFLSHWWLRTPFLKIEKHTLPRSLYQDLVFYLGGLFAYIDFYGETDPMTGLVSVFTRWRYQGAKGPAFLIGGACRPDPQEALWSGLLEVLVNLNSVLIRGKTSAPGTTIDFEQVIKSPADRIRFYQNEESACVTDPYFEGAQSIPWEDLRATSPSRPLTETFCFDMTPPMAKMAGCSVARVTAPELIPMEGAHSQRPLWHAKIQTTNLQQRSLQTFPHPYP
ncbi:MAG: YcaO-like family protein [Bdellovibrio sp.]|nr:YcaO-like family protein [Bdellovibrio sp.]